MKSVTDEDGVDGPFEAGMDAAMRIDASSLAHAARVKLSLRLAELERTMELAKHTVLEAGRLHQDALMAVRSAQGEALRMHEDAAREARKLVVQLAVVGLEEGSHDMESVQDAVEHHSGTRFGQFDIRQLMRLHSGLFLGPATPRPGGRS